MRLAYSSLLLCSLLMACKAEVPEEEVSAFAPTAQALSESAQRIQADVGFLAADARAEVAVHHLHDRPELEQALIDLKRLHVVREAEVRAPGLHSGDRGVEPVIHHTDYVHHAG